MPSKTNLGQILVFLSAKYVVLPKIYLKAGLEYVIWTGGFQEKKMRKVLLYFGSTPYNQVIQPTNNSNYD